MFGNAMLWFADTARNSNLLPVKANGLVRLRSPASRGSFGSTLTPVSRMPPCLCSCAAALLDLLEDVRQHVAEEDRDDRRRRLVGAEAMIVAGAGDAEREAAPATCARRGAPRRRTPGTGRCRAASSPGLSRLLPRSSLMLQFRCLPEPLTPANGFSCSRQASPYFGADALQHLHRHHLVIGGDVGVLEDRRDFVLARRDLVVARLDRHAAPCRARLSTSIMNASTRSGIAPKY